jgi:hypothetical protein
MIKNLFLKAQEWFTNNSELSITITFILLLCFAFFDAAAASAAAVGFCAFLATYWQAKISREHNRLSVRPKVQFEKKIDPDNGSISFGLVNHGLGPAILDEIILTIHSQKGLFANNEMQSELKRLCRESDVTYTPFFLLKNSNLRINKKYDLMNFTNSTDNPMWHQNVDTLMRTALNFEFKYKSMYGEEFKVRLYEKEPAIEKAN